MFLKLSAEHRNQPLPLWKDYSEFLRGLEMQVVHVWNCARVEMVIKHVKIRKQFKSFSASWIYVEIWMVFKRINWFNYHWYNLCFSCILSCFILS